MIFLQCILDLEIKDHKIFQFDCADSFKDTELPKYYSRLQAVVARDLGLTVRRLAGRHTDAAPKHTLLFQFSFRVIGHAHRRTFAKRRR